MHRPSGTVTFLFTDIEGSTRRWEADADAMRIALAAHDEVLRAAIENHGGWLFKHTGDGVCAAFASARAAVDAAVAAQRLLGLPVRMGIATGEAEQRGDDYFGPALNRAARVMAVGHGGQILLSNSTAALVTGVDLLDLGERRLRDLLRVEHLFEVRAEGLATGFPPLRSIDAVPGKLPTQTTSFVGRETEVRALIELVWTHRLVTLTGVGGVGKTRLAIQVAAELVPEFPDGVWLVELAPIGDPAALPGAVATALGITVQPGMTVTASVAHVLAGRQLLIVLDNCEHLIDAAAELVEAILARSSTVKIIATSREGLRVGAEHLWSVASLDTDSGAHSAAAELFMERAETVVAGFALHTDDDRAAVTEICTRLDGIPLAIELAAARMVSMTPQDIRDRLSDRFRLLSGYRRGFERHQTLRHAVQWSYDLLDDDERRVLQHASVFSEGFNLAAITHLCERFDEYTTLDLVDSLVRKSLVTSHYVGGHARYRLLETIRAFAEEQLAVTGTISSVRDRHARYYAAQAVRYWDIWEGPGFDTANQWAEVELDNLRTGYHWATDQGDIDVATAIAAHATMLMFSLHRYEPVRWAEELLPAAVAADVAQLPRLYTAATTCVFLGRAEDALSYAESASALQDDARYEPFDPAWARHREGVAHGNAGRFDRLEIFTALASKIGLSRVLGLCGQVGPLMMLGRATEAQVIAEDAVNAARAHANPQWIAVALYVYGFAFAQDDPARALQVLRQGLDHTRDHRLPFIEALIAVQAAPLEARSGRVDQALHLFSKCISSFHQAGNPGALRGALVEATGFFDQIDRPEIAATLHGVTTHLAVTNIVLGSEGAIDRTRRTLDAETFDRCVATGAAMETAEAVRYAHTQIELVRGELAMST